MPNKNAENFARPPLTRLDSRSNVLIRPGYPNQPGVQFRPPPRPGAPQFAQRPPTRPPIPGGGGGGGGGVQQPYPTNLGPRPVGGNVGVRPATPYPRQPSPNQPRPQGYPLPQAQIRTVDSEDNVDLNEQNMALNLQTSKEDYEKSEAYIDNVDVVNNTRTDDYVSERTESKSNLYMNRIEEDEQDQQQQQQQQQQHDDSKYTSETSHRDVVVKPRKEDVKSTVPERPPSAMRTSKTPTNERPHSAMKSPNADRTNLTPRARKVPNNFNGTLRSPKPGY